MEGHWKKKKTIKIFWGVHNSIQGGYKVAFGLLNTHKERFIFNEIEFIFE
jgi:hypothetical protein